MWLEPDEVAAMLRTSTNNVYKLAHRNKWAAKKHGRRVRYSFKSVQLFLKGKK